MTARAGKLAISFLVLPFATFMPLLAFHPSYNTRCYALDGFLQIRGLLLYLGMVLHKYASRCISFGFILSMLVERRKAETDVKVKEWQVQKRFCIGLHYMPLVYWWP